MSALRAGLKPAISFCALLALPTLAGCASSGSHSYTAQNAPVSARVAQAATAVEDDGLPSQAPPPGRIRLMPDEPAEPFSKNYGGGNPAALSVSPSPADTAARARSTRPPIPGEEAPLARQKLTAVFNQDE